MTKKLSTKKPSKPAVKPARKSAPARAATAKKVTADPAADIDALVVKASKSPDARTKLRDMPADQVVPRLLVAMTHPKPAVRSLAYEMSTARPQHRELTPLDKIVAGLSDPDPKVRLSVLLALNRGHGMANAAVYAARGEEIRAHLAPLLADPDKRVKSQSAVMWGRLGLGPLP